jgi:hypothetical protein
VISFEQRFPLSHRAGYDCCNFFSKGQSKSKGQTKNQGEGGLTAVCFVSQSGQITNY